ncbi:Uncharacterised protein [Mycobacteroides abscessus subsp. abscessus]|nr:Uncharacterised protein [Mycobacteroides abscessus subsp. abscessus]
MSRPITKATDASPKTNPRLPSWKGRQAVSGSASVTAAPRRTNRSTMSGVPDRSEVTTTTSSARPASSHSRAVSTAALAELHAAETFMVGPWKPNSRMASAIGVDGKRPR